MHTFVDAGFGYTFKASSNPGDDKLFLDAVHEYELDDSAFTFI